jgi:hypothetical protein
MTTRTILLRSAAVLALAVTIVGSSTLTPVAAAAPIDSTTDLHSVAAKKKDKPESSSGESGLSDIPIIGDVVGDLKDAPPEEIISEAVQFAGTAADTVVPIIRSLIK